MKGCKVQARLVLQLVASSALRAVQNLKLEPLTPSPLAPSVTSTPCFFQGPDFPSPYVPPKASDHEEEPQAQEGEWEVVCWGHREVAGIRGSSK